MRQRIVEAWGVLIGSYFLPSLQVAIVEQLRANYRVLGEQYQEQKRRADLAAKLYNEAEVGRKQSSDAIGQLAIDKANLQASVDYLRNKLSQYEGTSV